jgi:hypothetical protein
MVSRISTVFREIDPYVMGVTHRRGHSIATAPLSFVGLICADMVRRKCGRAYGPPNPPSGPGEGPGDRRPDPRVVVFRSERLVRRPPSSDRSNDLLTVISHLYWKVTLLTKREP